MRIQVTIVLVILFFMVLPFKPSFDRNRISTIPLIAHDLAWHLCILLIHFSETSNLTWEPFNPRTRMNQSGFVGSVLFIPVWHLYSHVKMFAYTCSNMYPTLHCISPPSKRHNRQDTCVCILVHLSVLFLPTTIGFQMYLPSFYLCFIKSKAYYFLEIVSLILLRSFAPNAKCHPQCSPLSGKLETSGTFSLGTVVVWSLLFPSPDRIVVVVAINIIINKNILPGMIGGTQPASQPGGQSRFISG